MAQSLNRDGRPGVTTDTGDTLCARDRNLQ